MIAVAVEDLNIEMVKHLIEISKEAQLKLDFNSKDYWGNTPLHLVATAPSKPLEYVGVALWRQTELCHLVFIFRVKNH